METTYWKRKTQDSEEPNRSQDSGEPGILEEPEPFKSQDSRRPLGTQDRRQPTTFEDWEPLRTYNPRGLITLEDLTSRGLRTLQHPVPLRTLALEDPGSLRTWDPRGGPRTLEDLRSYRTQDPSKPMAMNLHRLKNSFNVIMELVQI